MNLKAVQETLREQGLDGWLFYDHHRRDPLAYRVLQLPLDLQPTRRWYYYIPAVGEPLALVHQIEPKTLDSLPGKIFSYSRWTEQIERLKDLIGEAKLIAMQYSPNCANPYVSMVDAGTIELVRSFGIDIVSSADLMQLFEARWTQSQLDSHLAAGRIMDRLRAEAFAFACQRLDSGVTEWDVLSFLRERFTQEGLITDHGPIVAANANASNPHYEPTSALYTPIHPGDLLLIDMWAKLDAPYSVYYDITWTGVCGEIPAEVQKVFDVVTGARNLAIKYVVDSVANGQPIHGYEIDDICRQAIHVAGYGEYFIHRTGHSIGMDVHGAGANLDNFETHDERRIIPWTCFSIEPGIYLPHFGIRSEVNVFVGETEAYVTGEIQRQLVSLG